MTITTTILAYTTLVLLNITALAFIAYASRALHNPDHITYIEHYAERHTNHTIPR